MSANMEVDKTGTEGEESNVAIHPLAIVHMSDQYTRISCGGSPLKKDAPVVGLLFGQKTAQPTTTPGGGGGGGGGDGLQILDADDIPTEISEASTVQIELHRAVFPQHSVVGWYRVSQSSDDDEPNANDLNITQQLKQHHAPDSMFCFCLLQVSQQEEEEKKQSAEGSAEPSTLDKELPINLYSLATVDNTPVLLGLSNWQLDTAEPERIAVERVMKEKPQQGGGDGPQSSIYVAQAKSMQFSLVSMEERIDVLIGFLQATKEGKVPSNPALLRQVQSLIYSLGPLSNMADTVRDDSEMLAHLAAVAKTVNAVQSYTDKFRVMHESVARSMSKETRRPF